MKYEELICNQCGFKMVYNADNTWYLKCSRCGNVLVDIVLDESMLEELDVVNYVEIYGLQKF